MSGISAVSPSAAVAAPGAATSIAGLQSQIDTYRRQLAECENCAATAASPEGKQKIQSLTGRIAAAEARIAALQNQQTHETTGEQGAPAAQAEAIRATRAVTERPAVNAVGDTLAQPDTGFASVGSRVDLYA